MTSESLLVNHDGPLTWLRFNRPSRRNALDAHTLHALAEALHAAHARAHTRVILIAGDAAAFSTGADLNEYADYDAAAVRRTNRDTWMRVFEVIETLDEPVIAVIRGYALAGGTELLLACDLVVAGDGATFGLTEARVGVIPGAGACARLPRWVGRAAAKEILMLGDLITAAEAHRLGLVNRLVADDEVEVTATELALRLATRSPSALAAAKRAVNVGGEMSLEHGIAYALDEFALLFGRHDQQEGMQAFLEKREPRFTGA